MGLCSRCSAELPHGRVHTWCSHCLREYTQERAAMAMKAWPRRDMPPENQRIAVDNLLPLLATCGETARADKQRRLAQQDLYVIHNPSSGLVKVGRSVDVQKRFNALQSGAGQVMTLVKQFERKGLCEMACHEKLSAWHTPPGREWFNASPEQVLQVVEQVVRDTRELSEEEEEEEDDEEEKGDAEEAPSCQRRRAPARHSVRRQHTPQRTAMRTRDHQRR